MLDKLIFGDVAQELAGTRKVLEQVPDEHLDWKPHAKSYRLGDLATHLVNIATWQIAILTQPEYDLASGPFRREALPSRAAMLEEYDGKVREIEKALAEIDEKALAEPWTLRMGDRVILSQPRAAAMRTFGISHMVHHRAQLGVYLRLLDIPVPGVYGPSADDMGN